MEAKKHPILYVVVYDEKTKHTQATKDSIKVAEPHYEKIELLTLQEAKAMNLDLMKPNIMMENWLLKKILEAKVKEKSIKNKLMQQAQLRVAHKGKVLARRRKNKNKKTHR